MINVLYFDDGDIALSDSNIEKVQKHLDPGFYSVETTETMFSISAKLKSYEVKIPKSARSFAQDIVDFDYFRRLFSPESEQLHRDMGINCKVGCLFYGKQGSGKTTTIQAVAELLIEEYGSVVFVVEDYNGYKACRKFIKQLRKNRDFITVILWDECEDAFRGAETELKPMLDGTKAIDRSVLLCSTNYIDKIPDTIKDRPSRFKYVIDISSIKEPDIVFSILQNMNKTLTDPLTDQQLRDLVSICTDKTVDEIKNAFTDACFQRIGVERVKDPVIKKPEVSIDMKFPSGGFHDYIRRSLGGS